MKNLKFSLLFAASLFVACMALTSCKTETETDEIYIDKYIIVRPLSSSDGIAGKWKDGYTMYNTYGTYDCQYTPTIMETASWEDHTGTVYIRKTSDTSGYLYYQFDHDITSYANGVPYTVSNTSGKWCAVAYRNLTSTTVEMCDAYKDLNFPSTLEGAALSFTIENGYFNGINTSFEKVPN